mgnify:CR=1 FL=1
MKELVCIGGPADGLRATPEFNGYIYLDQKTNKEHQYRPVKLVFYGIESWVLFENGMPPKDVIGELLKGYKFKQRI